MSQEIYRLDTTKDVRDIIPNMQKTIEAGLSTLSGTAFPTTNLVVGMQCYRTDLKRIYVLESVSPLVWKIESSGHEHWNAVVKGSTWSRICLLTGDSSVLGSAAILTITGTRSSIVYNASFLINTSHSQQGNIIQLSPNTYNSNFKLRLLVNGAGSCCVDFWDTGATSVLQGLLCYIQPLTFYPIVTYTTFVDDSAIPAGYAAKSEITTSWIGNPNNANIGNAIVKRDASGNFSAGTITANLTGNATTATNATTAANATTLASFPVAANKAVAPASPVDVSKILKTESDGILRAYRVEAQYYNTTATTETTTPTRIFASTDNYIRPINPANVRVGFATTATNANACTGNSATATKLATSRNIALTGGVTGSVNFDGSGNVSINTAISLNNVFVKQGTAPTNNAILWINTTNRTLNYHDGTAWVQIVGVYADA